jgi:hypothetical protein
MQLLIQLRWMAVVGQLVTIWYASQVLRSACPCRNWWLFPLCSDWSTWPPWS